MPEPRALGIVRGALVVLRKDVLLEWRTRARINALVFFAVATLLMMSFAIGPDTTILREHAPGYIWLGLFFASVLSLGESFRVEGENFALDGLRLAPVDARAVFLGKALGNALMLFALAIVITPIAVALFGVNFPLGVHWYAVVLLLGCLGISAPGTVFAAIANNARARDVLLPLLLFPLLVPALIASVNATSLTMDGDPQDHLRPWLTLLLGFDLLYWALGFLLFPKVIED